MTETYRLRLPELAAAQAQKHVTHNEALNFLDTLVQASVLDKDLTAPPGSPTEGDCYIVAASGGTATGAWASWEKRITRFQDGQWISFLPGVGNGVGWTVWVQDEKTLYTFDGTNWMNALRGKTGGGIAVQYVFDTTTTNSDPGNGVLRLDNATQNAAATVRADLLDVNGTDWTAALASLADSTSTVKGHLRLFAVADPSKWLLFTVSAVASPSGYKNITVANVSSSAASPFSNGDAVVLSFSRTGDAGAAGANGTNGTNGTSGGSNSVCDFRLTLTSGVPVPTSDVTAATTLYCAPYRGNRIALYDGTSTWTIRSSAQFSVSLAGFTANTNYDVFCYDNAGTPTLELLAWSSDTARATALTTQDGVLVKTGATTRRYLGTIRITGTTGQSEFSFGGLAAGGTQAKLFVWNYYNRVRLRALVRDSTDSWTYSTNTWRPSNNSTGMRINVVIGVAEDFQVGTFCHMGLSSSSAGAFYAGVGLDSTTAPSGVFAWPAFATGSAVGGVANPSCAAQLTGFHYFQALENASSATQTGFGDNGGSVIQNGLYCDLVM